MLAFEVAKRWPDGDIQLLGRELQPHIPYRLAQEAAEMVSGCGEDPETDKGWVFRITG